MTKMPTRMAKSRGQRKVMDLTYCVGRSGSLILIFGAERTAQSRNRLSVVAKARHACEKRDSIRPVLAGLINKIPSVRRDHQSKRPSSRTGRRPWDDDWPFFWRLARWR